MSLRPISSALRLLVLALDLVVAAGLLMSAYGGAIDPATSVVPQLLGMTFPLWIVAVVVMLPLSFVVWRRCALLPALALLAALPSALTIAPLNVATTLTDAERDSCFSVMTYNVYTLADHEYEKRGGDEKGPSWGNRCLQQAIASGTDIVCLQEAYVTNRFQHQIDSLQRIYPYSHYTPLSGEYIFSKYPLEVVPTPHPEWHSAHFSAYMLTVGTRRLLVVNCHLQSIGLTPDDKDLYRELTDRRLESPTRSELSKVKNSILSKLAEAFRNRADQARTIAQFLDDHPGNAVLVGDFNDVQLNYAYRCIRRAGLRDAYADAAFGPTITYIDNRFYFHIDQVLYRGDMEAVAIRRGNVPSSDHYPLTATFLWK